MSQLEIMVILLILRVLIILICLILNKKITDKTGNNGRRVVLLNNLSNIWKTPEILLINCEINLILTCSASCVIKFNAIHQPATFTITNTKLYVLVVDDDILEQIGCL